MDKVEKILIYAAIAASFFGAQVATVSMGSVRVSILRILFVALLGIALFRPSRIKKQNGYSLGFLLAWGIYAFISCIWSPDLDNWFREYYFLALGIFFAYLIQGVFHTKKEIIICVLVMDIMIQVQGSIGWYEYITGDYRFLTGSYQLERYLAYASTEPPLPLAMTGNPNNLALMLLFGCFMSVFLAKYFKHWFLKFVFWCVVASNIFLLYATASRANFIGLVLGILLLLLQSKKHIIITCIVIVASIPFIQNFYDIYDLFIFLSPDRTTGSDTIRINLIKNGLHFLSQSYGMGVGLGQIEYYMGNEALYPTYYILNIHNWWMEILVSSGVLIFVGYLLFYVRLGCSFLYHALQEHDSLSQMFFICMVVFSVGCISASSNMVVEWLWLFWAVCIAWDGIKNDYKENELSLSKDII